MLRSSCRDGLDEVRAAGADPNTPWAATVVRLCDDIVLEKKHTVTGGNEGRGRLVLWSSLYGIWLGIATDIMFDIDGDRAVILPPLLGLGAGLGLSLAATSSYQLSVGEAWTIITGLDYGTINGALWAGGLDFSDKGVVGTAVATSIAATSIGVLVANAKSPSAGDIEVVRSGLLWGTARRRCCVDRSSSSPDSSEPARAQGRSPRRWTRASSSASGSPTASICRATAC